MSLVSLKIKQNNIFCSNKSIFTIFCLIFVFAFLSYIPLLYGAEASSTSFIMSDSTFGSGDSMNSVNFSLSGTLSQSQNVSYESSSIPLVPGIITSCGKIVASGTYTLGTNLTNISGTCFTVRADNVNIEGSGYSISAVSGNTSYAIVATSTTVNGGDAYTNLSIQNITFSNFSGGINASGNNGTIFGGDGGVINVASSTLGSIIANGGIASSGIGGDGGTMSISGIDLNLAGNTYTVNRGTGSINGSVGVINLNGSVLVSGGQVWTGDDTAWQGARTWKFVDGGYSSGTITGTTTWMYYTASSSVVTIDSNTNFRGTGRVNGTSFDSLGENISTWNLINGSILIGSISGNIIFNDTSRNSGIVFDDAVFNDYSYNAGTVKNANFTSSSFNSVAGIPNADPTGISNGHTISGVTTFSSITPVDFIVNTGSTWSANTSSWGFATSGQNWTFNFSNNTGLLSGSAVFNSSQNNGSVDGDSTFNYNSYNAGTTATSFFYGNSYNIGNSEYASFYNNSINSHLSSAGSVSVRCDFFDTSLPGIGHCPLNGTFYHIPYYFNAGGTTHWGDVGNWYFDASSTEPALVFPQNGDIVYIGGPMTSGPSSPITLGGIIVASSTTGGGSFSVDFTNASGPAYFYSGSTNAGVVNGVFHIFGNRSISSVNTTGSFTGNVAFHDGAWNDISLASNANVTFYDTSYNDTNGIVNGNAEFAGTNINNGIVVGVATINAGATLSGNGTILNNAVNLGNIEGGIFNGIVTSVSGAVTGAITNLFTMIFNNGSYVSGSGRLSGDAEFNATSSNRGVVSGDSIFNNSSYNIGSTSNATFVGDLSENIYNGITGIVSGIKTRLYTAIAPQLNLFRNFADSAWTVVADNTVVKLLFGDLFNTSGQNETTFIERNGGFILRPLTPGVIASCGVLDTENGTYTLGADISNYKYDTCFIVRANGVVLDGASHFVAAQSASTSIYAVVSTSTMSVDATSSAFTNLTIKNIRFTNFAKGLLGRGTDVPNGIGGNGTSVYIDHTTIGDIDVSGGDPTEKGGDGGAVTLETSITNNIISRGGDSTACGIAGNGGNIFITTDSVYATSTNDGGIVSGCPENVTPTHGSRGRINTTVISSATKAAQSANQNPIRLTHGSASRLWDFSKMTKFLLPVLDISPLRFSPVPTFGTDKKSSFSFLTNMKNFLFAPLSKEVNVNSVKVLNFLGIKYQKDLIKLKNTPIVIKDTKNIPELFNIFVTGVPAKTSGGDLKIGLQIPVTSYIIYSGKASISQLVKVQPKMEINISSNSLIKKEAMFNGKKVAFIDGKVAIMTPVKAGRYNFVVNDAQIPLIIEVISNTTGAKAASEVSNSNLFIRVINWFSKLF